MKYTNIYIVGFPKGEERDKICKEITTENFPNMMKTMDLHTQEVQ